MRQTFFTLLLGTALGLAGCQPATPPEDAVATYRDGTVSVAETEQAMRRHAEPVDESADIDWLERYREAAKMVVLERTVLGDLADEEEALHAIGDEYDQLVRQITLRLFIAQEIGSEPQATPQEVEDYYANHQEAFQRQAKRFVWNLFRSHATSGSEEATLAFLHDLKQRAKEGIPFRDLALRHSESESRKLEGRLGWLERDGLPPALEKVVFGLDEGEVSEPVLGGGGGTLFYVSEVVEEKHFPFEDVRLALTRRLRRERAEEAIAAAVDDVEPPAGSTVLTFEEVWATLERGEQETVVLEIGDYRLTAEALRQMVSEQPPSGLPIEESAEDKARRLYAQNKNLQLLYQKALASGFVDDPANRQAIDERAARIGRALLFRHTLEARMRERAAAESESLRRFYEENRFLYQTPLRLKLKSLSVPLGQDAERVAAALDRLHAALQLGTIDLRTAATQVGGQVRDLGWLEPDGLAALEPKVRIFILDLDGTGFTIPFHLNRLLNILWVEAREEPRIRPYEAVAEQVLEDYYARNQQEIYRQLVEEILAEEDFTFHPATVESALGQTGGET